MTLYSYAVTLQLCSFYLKYGKKREFDMNWIEHLQPRLSHKTSCRPVFGLALFLNIIDRWMRFTPHAQPEVLSRATGHWSCTLSFWYPHDVRQPLVTLPLAVTVLLWSRHCGSDETKTLIGWTVKLVRNIGLAGPNWPRKHGTCSRALVVFWEWTS